MLAGEAGSQSRIQHQHRDSGFPSNANLLFVQFLQELLMLCQGPSFAGLSAGKVAANIVERTVNLLHLEVESSAVSFR